MTSNARWVVVLALTSCVVAFSGCPKKGEPSADYEQARQDFNQLYGRELEDAYVSPRMAPIEAQLEKVPEDSSDSVAARELLKRIRSGRERVVSQTAERDQAIAEARNPAIDFEFSEDPWARPDAGEPEAPDAGASEPVAGMPMKEVLGRWGDCFLPGDDLDVKGRGTRSTFVLRTTRFCSDRHPGFDQKILILEAEEVLFIGEKSQVEMPGTDAGVSPSPARTPDAG